MTHRHLFSLSTLFFVAALLLFAAAGLGIPELPRLKYIGWGLFCLCLSDAVPI